MNENLYMRGESGTCNVCAAPCSSCMHFSRAISVMESKAEGGFSESSCGRKEADHCSFVNAGPQSLYRSRSCGEHQHAASEASNLHSASSSRDSFSENAESKATMRNPDTCDASDDVGMPPKEPPHEVVEENQPSAKQNSISSESVLSSHGHTASNFIQKTFSNQDVVHHELECHEDNISCVTGVTSTSIAVSDTNKNMGSINMSCISASTNSLRGKGFKMAADISFADGETNDSQSNTRRQSTSNEFVDKKSSNFTCTITGNSQKSGLLKCPPPNGTASSKEQSLHSDFPNRKSYCQIVGSKNMEEKISQLQGEPSAEHVEISLSGQLTNSGMDGKKTTAPNETNVQPNYEDTKVSHFGGESSVEALEKSNLCTETEMGRDGGIPSNMQGPQKQFQPTAENDNSDPEILEDDVKVCDICGDAGREELLAICSRCTDGAEHTYCMRIMLDKVPEGDWLCEECKMKEDAEIARVDSSETVSGVSKVVYLEGKNQNVETTFNPKLLPKLDVKAIASEAPPSVKGLRSPQIFTKRSSENEDVASISNEKTPEISGRPPCTASPSRKSILSRQSSSKHLDAGKVKPAKLASHSGSHLSNNSQPTSRLPVSSCTNSPRVQALLQAPRGALTKSSSFNNLKPKVKQVTENISQNPKMTRDSAINDSKKEGSVRAISKSSSSKTLSISRPNVDEPRKTQPVSPSLIEDPRNFGQGKERITIIERRNSFLLDRPPLGLSPVSATSIPLPKADMKATQCDGKLDKLPEPNALIANKGSEDAYVKKQPPFSAKALGNLSSNGICNLEDQKPSQVTYKDDALTTSSSNPGNLLQCPLPHSQQSANRDEKIKESTPFSSSRAAVSTGGRTVRCQRCNEMGHSTQFCSIDKLRVSALKPSAERNSKEPGDKRHKWRHAFDVAISKSRTQKTNRLSDQSEDLPQSNTDLRETIPKDNMPSSSACIRDSTTLERTTGGQDSLRSSSADPGNVTNVIDVKQQIPPPRETISTNRNGESSTFPTHAQESKAQLLVPLFPERDSVHDPLRASVIPELDYMWQGGFVVERTGRLPELCDGVQAHLSTRASPKVLEVMTKLPNKIQLEELPRLSTWPLQFQENSPTEENIALFFFAKDIESYEKYYSKLLENMLKNDLALKGNLDGADLLIFPSSKLPKKSERWNRLFFLWGVFRGRRTNCSGPSSGFQNKLCGPSLNIENMVQDFPSHPLTELVPPQNVSSHEHTAKDAPKHEKSNMTETAKSTIEFSHLSSLEGEDRSSGRNEFFTQKSLDQTAVNNKLPPDKCTLSPVFVTNTLTTMSYQTSSLNTCSRSITGMHAANICPEVETGSPCLKELLSNSGADHPLHVQMTSMPTDHNRGSPASMVESNCMKTELSSGSQDRKTVSSDSSRLCQPSSSLHVRGSGALGIRDEEKMDSVLLMEMGSASDIDARRVKTEEPSWDSWSNRKRAQSYSPEPVSQVYGETLNGTSSKLLWEEKTDCMSLDEGRESKKARFYAEAAPRSLTGESASSERSSSKVHPLLANFLDERLPRDSIHNVAAMPEITINSERYFFPGGLDALMDTETGNLIPVEVLSSDDEEQQESDIPNLELALGAEKKSKKQDILPLFTPLVDGKNNQDKRSDHADDAADDATASLSLSLSFPFPEKEHAAKAAPNTEQLPPGRPHVDTSLLLFGGFANR